MDRPTPRSTRAAALERRRALSHSGAAAAEVKQSRSRRSNSKVANGPSSSSSAPTGPAKKTPSSVPPSSDAQGNSSGAPGQSCGCEHGGQKDKAEVRVAIAVPAGRVVAQQRRAERCEVGRGDAPACRPSGRVRQNNGVAPKVELGTTLQGTLVTGTHVDPTIRVTGPEAGACRVITGTEYAGAEQYEELCDAVPEPGSAKVSIGSTSRGQRVTGTEVGRSQRVTGDEHGSCAVVTGTEYLSAEKVEAFCATTLDPAPAKVSVSTTRDNHSVSGTEVGRSVKVTGDEAGACSKLTGTQYVSSDIPESLCGTRAPRKVSVMSTARERTLTGTAVGHSPKITGDDYGACATVSGTEYVGLEQYQACNRPPVLAPDKVGVMRTWRGQEVSGTAVEHSQKVTGDEYGACQAVSGDEYVGPDQYGQYCDPQDEASAQSRVQTRGPEFSPAPSGTRVARGGRVTGSGRGEAVMVSGTPYAGSLQGRSGRLQGRFAPPAAVQEASDEVETWEARGGFSVKAPASAAKERSVARITGTAYGGGARITGPVDRAEGLVSGTPEFRYREENPAPRASYLQARDGADAPSSRLTGEGRELGAVITGAAWRPNGVVTGTEGASARRNPTMRGDARGGARGAMQNRDIERAEVPMSRITGGSGNYPQGSLVTYSGGARG